MEAKIEIKVIENNDNYLKKIEKLYYSAFAENERIPFDVLKQNSFPNSKKLGIFDDKKFVGFAFVSEYKTLVYLVYLAVEENCRNKGYGSSFLKSLQNMFNQNTIALSADKPQIKNDLQSRRIDFYKRNGFVVGGFQFKYKDLPFVILHNKTLNKKILKEFLNTTFPDLYDYKDI